MTEEHNPASHIRDFLQGLASNPNVPSLKAVVDKIAAIPGVSQFKGIQVQVLRVQEELLKAQLMLVGQIIQAIETPSDPSGAPAGAAPAEPATNGKIIVA